MRWMRSIIFGFLLSLLLPVFCYAVNFPETLNFNNGVWKLAYKNETKNVQMAEYLTDSENVDNWTQLVTYQKFNYKFPKSVTPILFFNKEIEQLKLKKYELEHDIIESGSEEAIVEFRIKSPQQDQQDEIQRIIRTEDDGLLVLHYVTRKFDMGKENRDQWVKNLKTMDLNAFKG